MPGKAREIMELMENETVSVDLSELEGVNVWLMNNFSVAANITVTVDIFRLPDSLRNSPDRVKQLDYVFNKLEDGGYDCALPSTISSFDRAPLMKFVLPNQPYGADLLRHASENPKHRLRTVFTSTGRFQLPRAPIASLSHILALRRGPILSRPGIRRLPRRLPGPAGRPPDPRPAPLLLDTALQRAAVDHPVCDADRRRGWDGVVRAQEEP